MTRTSGALRFLRRALAFPALVVTAVATSACGGDLNSLAPAAFENTDRQYGVYAVTGTPSGLPAGYQFTSESLVRPQLLSNGSLNFDVAFDINAAGEAVVLSAKRVVPVPPSGVAPVGFLRWQAVYEQLARAPDKGYVDDTTATLKVGETISVRLTGSGCIYGDPIYAKLTIDSINVAERRLLVRSLINRNCGYRSLTIGIPTN